MSVCQIVLGNGLLVGIVVGGGVAVFVAMTWAWLVGEVADVLTDHHARHKGAARD